MTKTEFIIGVSYKSNMFNQVSMKINIYHGTEYNYNFINQVTVGIYVNDIFNETAFMVNNPAKISRLPSFLEALPIIFDGINSHSDKIFEFECNHDDNNNISVVISNMHTITNTTIVCVQVANQSSLNMLLSIEFYAIAVVITQLVFKSIVQT